MLLNEVQKKAILNIWNTYEKSGKKTYDTKGNLIADIDQARLKAIVSLKSYITDFLSGKTDLGGFRTLIDSFNKRNNLWGFTAVKGQMYFNQLVAAATGDEAGLTTLLRSALPQPEDLNDALQKIERLETYTRKFYDKAPDKRLVPKPSSVSYFLSYFWQIFAHESWPIMYTSLIKSFESLGLWHEFPKQSEAYRYFINLNNEIIAAIHEKTKYGIGFWDTEHAFWDYDAGSRAPEKNMQKKESALAETPRSDFNLLREYLLPRVAPLVELGAAKDQVGVGKGYAYEKMVSEVFKLIDFEVEELGQGKGRNPDSIIKNRTENTAFLVDAKAYSDGYNLGLDDRAIKEYIQYHCPSSLSAILLNPTSRNSLTRSRGTLISNALFSLTRKPCSPYSHTRRKTIFLWKKSLTASCRSGIPLPQIR